LPNRIKEPSPEDCFIEKNVVKADSIKRWVVQKGLLVMFPVKDSIPNDRCTCEEDVVALIKNVIVDSSATEKAVPAEHPDRNYVKHVLVKHIGN
jgi:hypothetical protein